MLKTRGGYTLQLQSNTLDPADGETQYYGGHTSWSAVASIFQAYVPKAGVLTHARLHVLAVGTGTGEAASVSVRINNTTDVLISSAVTFSAATSAYSADLAQSVAAGDSVEIKVVFPTFVTNPTGVWSNCVLYIQE